MNTSTNHHLNLFRYFHESHETQFIENNLSRAFAICLQQDLLFFSEYLRGILDDEDYDYLFSHYDEDSKYTIDLQLDTNSIELSDVKKIYAITMTGDEHLNMNDFLQLKANGQKDKNITDIWMVIKDMVFVIEVKRTNENCKQQLYNQIHPLKVNNPQIIIIPKNFSWPHTLRIMERITNIRLMREDNLSFIPDFLALCELRYPMWFPSKPFSQLPPLGTQDEKTRHIQWKRLRQIIQQSGEQILGYSDRMAIACKYSWATEVIPYFKTSNKVDYITFVIWPANTKGQGYSVYNKPLDWINKRNIKVGIETFSIETNYHLKFCHFNKYITSIDFNDYDLIKAINTRENFVNKSGKWGRDSWSEFAIFMDSHFKTEFNWREQCKWEKHFPASDRTYFTVSFGFITELRIPYTRFQELDKSINDFSIPANFIKSIVSSYSNLLD